MDVLDEHDISRSTAYRVIKGLILDDVLYKNSNGELEMTTDAKERIKEMSAKLEY
jgi:hypothetical protein